MKCTIIFTDRVIASIKSRNALPLEEMMFALLQTTFVLPLLKMSLMSSLDEMNVSRFCFFFFFLLLAAAAQIFVYDPDLQTDDYTSNCLL